MLKLKSGLQPVKPIQLTAKATLMFTGLEKCGKTTLLGSASELGKTIVIDTEGSAESLDKYSNVEVYPVTSYEQVVEIINALSTQDHDYKFVGVDTLNNLQFLIKEWIKDHIKVSSASKTNNSVGDPSLQMSDWDVLNSRFIDLLRKLHAGPYVSLWTCHLKQNRDERTGFVRFDPDMQGASAAHPLRLASVVGYMEWNKVDEEVVPVTYFQGNSHVVAGARGRFSKLPDAVPRCTVPYMFEVAQS